MPECIAIKDIDDSVRAGEAKEERFVQLYLQSLHTRFPSHHFHIVHIPGASDIDRLVVRDGVLWLGLEYKERSGRSTDFPETVCRDRKYQTALSLFQHLKIPSTLFLRFLGDTETNGVFCVDLCAPSKVAPLRRKDRDIERPHAFYELSKAHFLPLEF